MKLSLKLPLAFAAALLLVTAAALFGIARLNSAIHIYQTEVALAQRNALQVGDMLSQFKTQVQEWKNTLLRGKDAAQLDKYWNAFVKADQALAGDARSLMADLPAGEARELVQQFARAHAAMGENYRQAFEAFKAAGMDAAVGDKAVQGMDREPARLLDAAVERIGQDSAAVAEQARAAARRATAWSLGLMAIVCLGGVAAGVLFSRAITRRVDIAVAVADRVAAGDLGTSVRADGRDEIAQLLASLQTMQGQLARVVGEVRHNADSVASASAQIAQGNQDLSQRTEQQASALQQTAASMEQLGSTVRLNADNARQANQLAVNARDLAVAGGEVVGQVVSTMQGIQHSSQKIADIIGVIDGIAFQTNILALNAAVEAARAGEQGRGFAVVAGEVRSLAQRSAQAAREIKDLIGNSVEQVGQGATLVDQAGGRMQEIVAAIRSVTDLVAGISAASSEQSEGVNQVGDAVTQMDQATQQNAALVEESAAAAASLKQQAQRLVDAVAVFRLSSAA